MIWAAARAESSWKPSSPHLPKSVDLQRQQAEAFGYSDPPYDALLDQYERGEFGALLGWLRRQVHQHGRKFTSGEHLQRITGDGLNPAPHFKYMKVKYGEIYGL